MSFIIAGFMPESDWDKAVCDSILASLNEMTLEIGYGLYRMTVYGLEVRND